MSIPHDRAYYEHVMTTPTNDRQTSERERLAEWLDEIAAVTNGVDYRVAMEEAAAQLRADEAEIAQLRAERDEAFRMSRCECETNECCANLVKHSAELAALRAENEALRTVTEDDAEAAFYFFRDRYGSLEAMHATLQSFIRSKESRRAPE